jgi:ADP-ribose pyrophosphatase
VSLRPWRTLRSEVVLDRAPWLRVLEEDVELPDGRTVEGYLRLETRDFAVIVPVTEEGEVVLIRSYRRGPDAIELQPPGGIIEEGEEPESAAARELLEEAGCAAARWESLGTFVLGGNLGGGRAHFFLATGCRRVAEPTPGDLEEQEVLSLPLATVRQAWLGGEFHQLSATASLGLALVRLEGDRPL